MKTFKKRIVSVILTFLMLFSLCNGAFVNNIVYAADTDITIGNEVGKSYYGFQLTSVKDEPSIDSTVMIFTHVKTGAKLMYIKNEDTQRVFDITFRTPVSDNTGVNHIIEHSVLDGSKNYPVKSPFKEMLKGSLGSFINAMTSTDYTTYPVASTNEQDLENLMGVYLDAVFYPNLTTNSNIFKQEGWRYELPSKDSDLSVNGVVYNEMKGNYSDPQWLLRNAVNQSLFPDTSNKWDSGGNPDAIPTLSEYQFISTYKRNYTPSNSYIYLYGKLDIAKYLQFIDKNYLSKFDKVAVDTSIKTQKPLSNIPEKVVIYPVAQGSDTKEKTYLSLNYVTGNIEDKETNTALSFLSYLLMGTDNAPLKKALTDSNIAENVSSSFSIQGIQPVFSINAVNSDEASKEVFQKTILNTLQNISKNGFDKDFLKSALASYDISIRYEKLLTPMLGGNGIILSQTALATWIYDKDPTMYFETDSVMKKIKESDENKYFQNLINKYLLSNNYHSLVILKPDAGLESRNAESSTKKLEVYKSTIGEKGNVSLLKETEAFNAWQKSEDSKEAVETLPKLSLKDIKPELPDLSYKVENQSGINVLTHNADLNGLSSINLYFDSSKVPQDKLHYLSLLSALLGNVNTKEHSSQELSNGMLQHMGNPVVFAPSAVSDSKNPDKYSPKMAVSFMVPDDNISKSFDIVEEVINSSEFNDRQKIKQIIEQNKAGLQMIFTSGSGFAAIMRMSSYMNESGRYSDELTGYSYYKFLQDIDNNFDAKWEEISKNLKDTCSLVFNKNGLVASYSGAEESAQIFKKELSRVSGEINAQILPQQKYTFAQPDKNTAFSSIAKVQTIIQAGDFKKAGYKYSGKMMVLQNVLNMGYLWNKVRTTGGAYGVQSSFSSDGRVMLASMSDPNLKETLEAFKGAVDYLKNFKATDDEMANYIIGAVKDYVNLKTTGPLMEGALCDSMYLTNSSSNELLEFEKEALSTTPEDIRNYGDMLDKILKQNIYFVEGSKEKIEQNKQLFNEIIDYGK
ncbi:MAG: peptidase [Clostridiales bacterium]|nr:peptidase [Clostridiales bacterium]